MRTILAAIIALGLATSVASARPVDDFFTKLNESAPRSLFDDINASAPRSLFDSIRDSAPRSASGNQSVNPDLAGE